MKAILKFTRISPRKIAYFPKFLSGKKVNDALDELKKEKSRKKQNLFRNIIISAIHNAKEKGAKEENLIIKRLIVSRGPAYKRRIIRSRGRADILKKRTSHISVVLEEKKKKRKKSLLRKTIKKKTNNKLIKKQKLKKQIRDKKIKKK